MLTLDCSLTPLFCSGCSSTPKFINYRLYEVIPGIYQVRGLDLSNISFVRGKTGWIRFDPLVTKEVVRAAWKLFQEHIATACLSRP